LPIVFVATQLIISEPTHALLCSLLQTVKLRFLLFTS